MKLNRLTTTTIVLGLAATFSPVLHAQAISWRIDPLHSSAQFSVRHMTISTVRGQFGGVKGTVLFDPKNPAASSVEATIDCSTVNTGETNAVTRQVILDLDAPTQAIRDTQGREKIGVSGLTKISRKDFGILYNPIMETGGVAVSDEVSINLEIELIKNQK